MITLNQVVYASQMDYSIGSAIVKMFFYVGIVILILFMAMYGTKFIAKNTRRFISSKYMKVIDVLNLGTNAKILIVEMKDNVYIIGVSNNSIELIDKLSKEEIGQLDDFQNQLDKYTSHLKNKRSLHKNLEKFFNSRDNIYEEEVSDDEKDV